MRKIGSEVLLSNQDSLIIINIYPRLFLKNNKIISKEFPEEDFYTDQLSMFQYIESFFSIRSWREKNTLG